MPNSLPSNVTMQPPTDAAGPVQPPTPPSPVTEAARLGGPLGSAAIGALVGAQKENANSASKTPPLFDMSKAVPLVQFGQPPQDTKEHIIHNLGGGAKALSAYRASKNVVESADALYKAKPETFQESQHAFKQAVNQFPTDKLPSTRTSGRNVPAPTGQQVHLRASDGSEHVINDVDLGKFLQIDPQAKILRS